MTYPRHKQAAVPDALQPYRHSIAIRPRSVRNDDTRTACCQLVLLGSVSGHRVALVIGNAAYTLKQFAPDMGCGPDTRHFFQGLPWHRRGTREQLFRWDCGFTSVILGTRMRPAAGARDTATASHHENRIVVGDEEIAHLVERQLLHVAHHEAIQNGCDI